MKRKSLDVAVTPVFVTPGYTPITSIRKHIISTYPLDKRVLLELAQRADAFGIQDARVWRKLFDHALWIMQRGFPEFVNRRDVDMMLADAAWCLKHVSGDDLTAAQHYEVERWIDYLPDAYDAVCKVRERPRRGRRTNHEKYTDSIDGAKYAQRYA